MEEEAECKLNLDQDYQKRKNHVVGNKNTEWEIKAKALVHHCYPYQLCQDWKPEWSENDAFCSHIEEADPAWETLSDPISKDLVDKFLRSQD